MLVPELLPGDELRLARGQLHLALLDLGQPAETRALLGEARLGPLLERAQVGLALLQRGDLLGCRGERGLALLEVELELRLALLELRRELGLALLHVGLRALDGELALCDLRHPLCLALLEPGREVGLALLELRGELGLALLELRLGALERELALGGRRRALRHLLQRAGARLVGGLQRLGLELDLLLSLVGARLRLLEGRVRGRDLLAHRLGLRQLLGGRSLTGGDGGLGRGELGDALV